MEKAKKIVITVTAEITEEEEDRINNSWKEKEWITEAMEEGMRKAMMEDEHEDEGKEITVTIEIE